MGFGLWKSQFLSWIYQLLAVWLQESNLTSQSPSLVIYRIVINANDPQESLYELRVYPENTLQKPGM